MNNSLMKSGLKMFEDLNPHPSSSEDLCGLPIFTRSSMECMILSAIVLSLTAAHLKKKSISDPNSSAKVTTYRENEKKKASLNRKHHKSNNSPNVTQQCAIMHEEHAQEYMQKNEYLKIIENERRNEEKKLKKRKKREERLKKRQEEDKKEKANKEHNLGHRFKREQQKNVSKHKTVLDTGNTALDMFCYKSECSSQYKKRQNYLENHQNRILRFEQHRSSDSSCNYSINKLKTSLASGGSSLSVSCSSLSSISSSDSSYSPNPPSPLACTKPAWNIPHISNTTTMWTSNQTQVETKNACCTTVFPVKSSLFDYPPVKSLGFSTSLFCTEPEEKLKDRKEPVYSGQYTLFGAQRIGRTFYT